jgi:hypothetical protein
VGKEEGGRKKERVYESKGKERDGMTKWRRKGTVGEKGKAGQGKTEREGRRLYERMGKKERV